MPALELTPARGLPLGHALRFALWAALLLALLYAPYPPDSVVVRGLASHVALRFFSAREPS